MRPWIGPPLRSKLAPPKSSPLIVVPPSGGLGSPNRLRAPQPAAPAKAPLLALRAPDASLLRRLAHRRPSRHPLPAAQVAHKKLLVLAELRQGRNVPSQTVTARRVEEQFDVGLLARLEQLAVDAHRVLVQHVAVLHAVYQQQLAL